MDLKKILSELEIVNDVNSLPLQELAAKYLKDEETYNNFSNNYYNFFINHPMYQLRVSDHYEKIANLYLLGTNKFNSQEGVETRLNLLDIMSYDNKRFQLKNEYKTDKYEAESLFFENFGNALPSDMNYNLLLLGIEEGAKQYAAVANSSRDSLKHISDRINNRAEEKGDVKRIIDEYASSNEGLSLCNNMSYLLFANYMISSNPNMIDENFKKEAEQIIKTSQLLQCAGYDNFNIIEKNDYNKLAKFTLKNIKKQEKKENKEDNRALRKVKHFFANNSNK